MRFDRQGESSATAGERRSGTGDGRSITGGGERDESRYREDGWMSQPGGGVERGWREFCYGSGERRVQDGQASSSGEAC